MSSLVWVICDLIYFRKPSVIGAIQGMITGLVAITPAAGVVAGWGAIALGVGSGTIPWLTMNIAGRRMSIFARVDDTLEVFHTHFVGALVGGIGTGLFATVEGCAAFGLTNPGGAVSGNGIQVWYQLAGALFIIGWNIVWTSLIMLFISKVCRIPLRMSEEMLAVGDYAVHGEEPYTL
jgi:Amt family ammonium transporter